MNTSFDVARMVCFSHVKGAVQHTGIAVHLQLMN